jgi:DNA repair protein RecN (Recombination protein N)
LEIDFQKGLNIITGETGSGKSIMLGALGLILGERAEKRVVMNGERKCIVEGSFSLDSAKWKSIFEQNDLDFDQTTILRREVLDSGKSRAFINDTPVNLKLLREIAIDLVDIHSQHQTIQLNDPQFQLNVIDSYADAKPEKSEYSEAYASYAEVRKRLAELKDQLQKERQELDFIQFQLKELNQVDLDKINEAEMEEEYSVLSNSEEIAQKLKGALDLLGEGENPIISSLKQTSSLLEELKDYSGTYAELSERLKSTFIELEDIEREIYAASESVEMDPQRLAQLEDLKTSIFRLEQKHQVNGVEALLERKDQLSARLTSSETLEDEIESLEKEQSSLLDQVLKKGKGLSQKRRAATEKFSKELVELLSLLNMKKASVEISLEKLEKPSPTGLDKVEILFSANKGRPPEPLKEVASGGELSRLMLSIKKLSASPGRTIILDEIDTGVSGEVANSMGRIMKEMGQNQQVLSITHLPQIASKGEAHFKVFKVEKDNHTETKIERLADEERIEEIASMLSGKEKTSAAIDNARDLLTAN